MTYRMPAGEDCEIPVENGIDILTGIPLTMYQTSPWKDCLLPPYDEEAEIEEPIIFMYGGLAGRTKFGEYDLRKRQDREALNKAFPDEKDQRQFDKKLVKWWYERTRS